MTTPGKRRRLGELLIEAGVLDPAQLQAALVEQQKWGGKLGRTVVEMGFVDEDSMVRALSRQLKLPVVDLDNLALPASVTRILTVDLCERYGVFPLGSDAKAKLIQLATSDPTNIDALSDITFKTGMKVQTAVATGSSIDRAVRRMYYGEQTQSKAPGAPGTMQRYGQPEPQFEIDEISGVRVRPSVTATQPIIDPNVEMEAAARSGEMTRLRERLTALEKQSAGQVRALRALVELLVESGLVSRTEYVAKANSRSE